jgi:hypothetical protein
MGPMVNYGSIRRGYYSLQPEIMRSATILYFHAQ